MNRDFKIFWYNTHKMRLKYLKSLDSKWAETERISLELKIREIEKDLGLTQNKLFGEDDE